jgi:hypothetical protein
VCIYRAALRAVGCNQIAPLRLMSGSSILAGSFLTRTRSGAGYVPPSCAS